MFARVVADRYARALLQSSPDLNSIEVAQDELEVMERTWNMYPDIRSFFLNPKIPPKIKIEVIEKSLGQKFNPVVVNLLKLLIEKRRQELIPDISQRYTEICDNVRGVEHAEITLPVRIPDDVQKKLLDAIQRFSTRKVEIAVKIDPAIVGGVVIKLGDKVVDGSLKSRFDDMKRSMLAARLPRMIRE